MILSGNKIKEEVKNGNISIYPFEENMLNPNSYNYHLGDTILEIEDEVIDPHVKCKTKEIKLSNNGYLLKPNKLYLASTKEKIGSKKYVTQLIGRSSTGRLGLFLQVTAPLGHVGCNHCWTLELRVVMPLRVYPNMRIGQVTFWRLDGKKDLLYDKGKYNNYLIPQVSMFYEEGVKNDIIRK